jgi:hypothetical protein
MGINAPVGTSAALRRDFQALNLCLDHLLPQDNSTVQKNAQGHKLFTPPCNLPGMGNF